MVGVTLLLVTVSKDLFSPAKTMTNKPLVAETFRLALASDTKKTKLVLRIILFL